MAESGSRAAVRRWVATGCSRSSWLPFRQLAGKVGHHQPVVGSQAGLHGRLHALSVNRGVAADLGVDALRLIEQAGIHREAIGAFRDPLKAPLDSRAAQVSNALE